MTETLEHGLSVIGHNQGPPLEPSAFEVAEKRIEDLYAEAAMWLDGATCDSQDLCDGLSNLKALIAKARKEADEARDTEKRPFLEAGREVDTRYKPILARADLALEVVKKAIASWLKRLADEQTAKAAQARAEADKKAAEAQAAIRASDPSNLTERAAAETLLADAKRAEAQAGKAEKAKPLSGGAVGRRDGLVTVYSAEIVDPIQFGGWCWRNYRERYVEFLQSVADDLVKTGKHVVDEPGSHGAEIVGVRISSEQKVR
jgi:hypothetical protein